MLAPVFTPDALQLGPLTLEWGRLSFLLALFAALAVLGRSRDAALERTATAAIALAVIAARLGFILEHRASFAGAGLLEFVDARSGGFSWWWSLVALVPLWRVRSRRRWAALGTVAFAATGAALAPLLFKPKLEVLARALPPGVALERLATDGSRSGLTVGDLDKPVLLNVWASWCGPCRAEMPLLADAAKRGARIAFVNAGETPEAIGAYLAREGLALPVLVDAGELRSRLRVVGLPTSLVLDRDGRVLERHFGPLDRGQLAAMLARSGLQER